MAAPQHKVLLLGLKGFADKSDRDLSAIANSDDIDFSKYLTNFIADLSQDIVHIQTDKDHATLNPGRFVLRLANRKPYARIMQAHDLILIALNEGEKNSPTVNVMLGVIVRVTQPIRIANEQASHYIEVHGQDLARWLYTGRNFFYFYTGIGADAHEGILELKERQELWRILFPNQGNAELPSVQILSNILLQYIGRIMPRVGEVFAFHPVRTESTEAKYKDAEPFLGFGEFYIPKNDLAAYSGSVSNLLEEHALEHLSELWCDTTAGGGFALYYRRRPFDQSDWESFKPRGQESDPTKILHTIPDGHMLASDLGKSDHEYYNFISVLPWIYASNGGLMNLLLKAALRLDISSIKNRGLRSLIASSPYLDQMARPQDVSTVVIEDYNQLIKSGEFKASPLAAPVPLSQIDATLTKILTGVGPLVGVADDWASTMWRWYSQLDRYQNGKVVIKGRPEIRVGHLVHLKSDTQKNFLEPYAFYVLGVSHDYEVDGGKFVTTLQLGRGQAVDGRKFVRPVTDGRTDIGELDLEKKTGKLQSKKLLKPEPFNRERELTTEIDIFGGGNTP